MELSNTARFGPCVAERIADKVGYPGIVDLGSRVMPNFAPTMRATLLLECSCGNLTLSLFETFSENTKSKSPGPVRCSMPGGGVHPIFREKFG